MDDMMELTAGDALVWRRLEAYAETRLSPDLATSSRLRARVLAVAHRQAALARAEGGLTILPSPAGAAVAPTFSPRAQQIARRSSAARRRGWTWKRAAAVVLVASLGAGMSVGGAFAARPGAPLYDARMWAETLTLPTDPSARAVAELERLKDRLREIAEATRDGDTTGATAALTAYETIVDEASASAILAGDDVAAAVLETGVGHNVEVLQALMARVPGHASVAISLAVDAAIARSADAVDRIHASRPAGGPNHNGGGHPAADPTPRATEAPTAKPTPKATAKPTATPRPTAVPATAKPKPTPKITPEPSPTPLKTPKPRDDGPHPSGPPGQTGRNTQGKP
jgi:hypothetical protein